MNAKAADCPPKNLLNDFGLGKLDNRAAETLSEHLETCADCRNVVGRMTGDSFVERMRAAVGAPSVPAKSMTGGESISNADSSSETPTTDGPDAAAGGRACSQAAASVPLPPELAASADYEIVKALGQGGMGTVYLARNRMMDRLEVLKVVSQSLLERPGALERFQQEIRSAARLLHPNIVAAHSVPRLGDLLVFAMEYVDGQDLAQVVKRRGPLPVTNAAFYIHQVALGLQHAHEKGMVHRDIKPSNLMLAIENKKHVVKILDFGLAKATSEKTAAEQAEDAGLTKTGQILGTPHYIAPEQMLDAHQADIRADIYSLGCTLYYLLSGHPPFRGQSMYEILQAHHQTHAQPLDAVRPDVPAELAAVVAKMMAKKPENRYQTPAEVAKALKPFFQAGGQSPKVEHSLLPQTAPSVSSIAQSPSPQSNRPIPVPAARPVPIAAATAQPMAASPPGLVQRDPLALAGQSKPAAKTKTRGAGSGRRPRLPRLIGAAGLAGLLILAGVMFKVRTRDGILALEVNEPNAEVAIDGERVTVTWADGGKQAEITVPTGSHKVEIKKDGFKVRGEIVEIEHAGRSVLVARLEPLASSASGKPELASSPANVVPRTSPDDGRPPQELLQAYRERIKAAWPGREDRLRIDEQNHLKLGLPNCPEVQDLTPLAGMRLHWLSLWGCKGVTDIAPLRGMPLACLDINGCRDPACLEAIKGMPLEELYVSGVTDLSPLRGVPLRKLGVWVSSVENIEPLKGMPLTHVEFVNCAEIKDLSPLVGMPLDRMQMWGSESLRDLAPLKGMNLTYLDLFNCPQVSDLSPLGKMPLRYLNLGAGGSHWNNAIRDLSPLRGIPLDRCLLHGCVHVRDFSPLAEAPLTELSLPPTARDEDLGVFKDTALKSLAMLDCIALTTLAPTAKMPLERLNVGGCERLADLSPLLGKELTLLTIYRTAVTDLTPLEGMRLEEVRLTPAKISKGIEILRSMTSLRFIGIGADDTTQRFTATEFWKRFDAGELTPTQSTATATAEIATDVPPKGPAGTPAPAIAPFDSKQARAHQEAWARHLGVPMEQANSIGMKLVLIPPGEFTMGSTPEQIATARKLAERLEASFVMKFASPDADKDLQMESPAHRVTLSAPRLMGATEITIGQFGEFVAATQYVTEYEQSDVTAAGKKKTAAEAAINWRAPGGSVNDDSPVTIVTWNDAAAFCNWLSQREKLEPCYQKQPDGGWAPTAAAKGYRLPTEAEWEYACRAGTTTLYSFGDDVDRAEDYGWYRPKRGGPVGTKLPNPFGLFDMHGGEWEWCQDRVTHVPYDAAPKVDPLGSTGGLGVVRGGAGWFNVWFARSGFRRIDHFNISYYGFRVVRPAARLAAGPSGAKATAASSETPAAANANSKPDPIGAKLAKAKESYEHKIQALRDGVLKALERREATARANGDKKLVDQIKAERAALEANGKLPTLVPTADYERQLHGARTQLEAAYHTAIKAYTKAAMDEQSAAVEAELAKFLKTSAP